MRHLARRAWAPSRRTDGNDSDAACPGVDRGRHTRTRRSRCVPARHRPAAFSSADRLRHRVTSSRLREYCKPASATSRCGWWHWLVYNIPASVNSLPGGAGDPQKKMLPGGALQGRTDFGAYAYGGPCPPPGKPHHYHFRLYALKVPKLDVPNDASAALIGFNVHANQIGTTEIMATYSR